MLRIFQVLIPLAILASLTSGENQQEWSHYTYNYEPYTLKCESPNYKPVPQDIITWTKHGVSGDLKTGAHYELRPSGGLANIELYIKEVTDDVHGIYVCHIKDTNDNVKESVVMGLNWGTRRYEDDIDKYKENIIVGAIAAGSTFVLIIAIGLISNFRYLSDESLEKRRARKEDRLGRGRNGLKNQGYVAEMTEGNHQTNGSTNVMESSYVHF